MTDQANDPTLAHRPVVLMILDGWGLGREEPGNAVLAAQTPVMDAVWHNYPHATLLTSGEAVGLPAGQMGNSEVGHLNLGAGFVVYQWITRIDRAIADGDLARNQTLLETINRCIERGTTLHFMGLVSDGGVHSHTRQLLALVRIATAYGLERIAIHAFTDGRDTPPESGLGFVTQLEDDLKRIGAGRIDTVSGRYYAMDRDHRWPRTKLAFDAVVHGEGKTASSAADAIKQSYADGVTDEFIVPVVIPRADGNLPRIEDGDAVISFNFRSDRMRQLVGALSRPDFDGFDRGEMPADLSIVTMTRYEDDLPVDILFPPQDVINPLARVISDQGMTQYHAAETEKYPHVTFFLNGGREDPFPGEERGLIPSPKVATYDLQPEMSAPGVCNEVLGAINSGTFDFIIVNFANGDMVGHTGVFGAAVKAVEIVDQCVGLLLEAILARGGRAIVTADHGTVEELIDRETGGPMTAHTTNPVPVIFVAAENDPLRHAFLRSDGILSAVAPTILELLGVTPPSDMDQTSLIVK